MLVCQKCVVECRTFLRFIYNSSLDVEGVGFTYLSHISFFVEFLKCRFNPIRVSGGLNQPPPYTYCCTGNLYVILRLQHLVTIQYMFLLNYIPSFKSVALFFANLRNFEIFKSVNLQSKK